MPIPRMNIMLFPGGKRKALTFSYDDGVLQDQKLISMMRSYGIKGTFNLNSGLLGKMGTMKVNEKEVDISTFSEGDILEIYRDMEVATHGVEHTELTGLGHAAVKEILEDRKKLEGILSKLVQGHAYPFGIYDDRTIEILKAVGIRYARTVKSTKEFFLPENWYRWNPTCHHTDPELMDLVSKFCEKGNIFGLPSLFYLWGHSYEFDADNNWELIEEFMNYVSDYRAQIWMATNIEIMTYMEAYKGLVFFADGERVYNPSLEKIWIEHLGKIYMIKPGESISFSINYSI